LKFILVGKKIVLLPTDVPDNRFYVCTLSLLSLMEVLKYCNVMITPHSGLVNLYACEYCFNPNVPVIAIMYKEQSGLSIGPAGYPLIEKMHYIFDSDRNSVVDELVRIL
jgi:ADP-heptose:LPS heptosyltransferase